MQYEMQEMSGERAKAILLDAISSLSEIDISELTTFEQHLLQRIVKNPPPSTRGMEWRLADE